MLTLRNLFILLIACLLTACVHIPSGPSVMTLPGSGKSFDQFRADEYECRQYAYEQVGGNTPRQASRASGVESAAIGAGTGLLMGGLVGSSTATTSGYASQRRYDISYIQCMYAKGHRVPIDGRITNEPSGSSGARRISTPPANFVPPPPPPGNPPLPPLR